MKTFLEIEAQFSSFETSKIIVIPTPYEATTTFIKGTKKGPSAILKASWAIEDYDIELGYEPYKKVGIHTLSPLRFIKDGKNFPSLGFVTRPHFAGPQTDETSSMEYFCRIKNNKNPHNLIYKINKELFLKNKIPIMLGGEHSITFGAAKAASESFKNLSVLQLDAHSDLRNSYHGSKFSHACVMRRVRELCPAVQVGIRSQDIEEVTFLKQKKLMHSIFYAESFSDAKINKIVSQLSKNVYITIDVDVFDPSIMPATGTPEPGGFSWIQVLNILKSAISKKNIVGVDVVELSPKPNLHHADFLAAKLVYKIIGYLSLKL